jgi:hypothetical protein
VSAPADIEMLIAPGVSASWFGCKTELDRSRQAIVSFLQYWRECCTATLSVRVLRATNLHIRIDAKRQALDALDVQPGRASPEVGNGGDPEIEPTIEAPKASRHNHVTVLTLSGSPAHVKP